MALLRSSRLVLPVWQRFLVLLFVFASTLALWLSRSLWLSTAGKHLEAVAGQADLLGAISSVIGISGAILNTVILLLVILTGTRLFAGDSEEPAILRVMTVDDLLADLGSGGRLKWIDRDVVDPSLLVQTRRILIIGKANQGKTREAIELVAAAVNEIDLVAGSRILVPDPMLYLRSPASLGLPIRQQVDRHSPLLLFLDDLPERFPREKTGLASSLIAELDTLWGLFVVATADESQLNDEYREWLYKKHGFKPVHLRDFSVEEAAELTRLAANAESVKLSTECVMEIASLQDVSPRRVQTTIRLLRDQGIDDPSLEQLRTVLPTAWTKAWEIERNLLLRRISPARYLLESLSAFSLLNLPLFRSLVILYARQCWNREQQRPGLPWTRKRLLEQALAELSSYGIGVHGNIITFPDYMVDLNTTPEHSSVSLKSCLLARAQQYRLSIVPPDRRIVLELLASMIPLAQWYLDKPEGYEIAESIYRSAYQVTQNRRVTGSILVHQAWLRLSGIQPRGKGSMSLRQHGPVIRGLRGATLVVEGRFSEALADLDDALVAAVQANDIVPPQLFLLRGFARSNLGLFTLALRDLDDAIALDPTDPTSLRIRAEVHHELGNSAEARADIQRALDLKPDYLEALILRAIMALHGSDKRGALESIVAIENACESLDCTDELQWHLHFSKGLLLEALEDLETAAQEYTVGLLLSEDYRLYWLRGNVNAALLNYDAAREDFKRVRELAPTDFAKELLIVEDTEFDTHFVFSGSKVARAAAIRQLHSARLPDLLRAGDVTPHDPALLFALAMHFRSKDTGVALHYLDEAIAAAPKEYFLYGYRASFHLVSAKPLEAIADYRTAIELSPHPKIEAYYQARIADVESALRKSVNDFIANELPDIVKRMQEDEQRQLGRNVT